MLAQGLTEHVTWTYDPLIAANAVFNLHKLGATCRTYKRNVYGEIRDDFNRGTPSDRCQVDWWLRSERVIAANEGRSEPESRSRLALRTVEGGQLLPTRRRGDGLLEPVEQALAFDGEPLAVPIPDDISALRQVDPSLALAWRFHLRDVLESALAAGYVMVDCARVAGHWSYLLAQNPNLDEPAAAVLPRSTDEEHG